MSAAPEETPDPLASATARMNRLDRRIGTMTALLAVALLGFLVSTTGWWLTARDQTATKRNGVVADCRSAELALTLDQFQVIVSPLATEANRSAAAAALGRLDSLEERYQDCVTDHG